MSGVKPADKLTEQDGPKRDRPRLVFQPIHAIIAILTLSCALCASLTMLVQQAIHYSALQQTQITQSKQSQANGTTKDGASSAATTPNQQPSMEQNGQNKQTSEPTEPSDPADGLLNINTAGSNELQTLKGVGPVTAQRIIDYRNQIGRFDNVDQLLEVKGIGEKTLAKFRDQVCAR
ncbi:ComEA family DNA-binding protein [Bifidobacterium catenulatum]|uniref:ComEA family DNA-binding protein n=1 Tax=Bifidobacterium catenulatum TaxID=1686 RepID=UPI001F033299|nr:helix-hairpin-helix domain-containing protein [Bifidobacterium catenulatum]